MQLRGASKPLCSLAQEEEEEEDCGINLWVLLRSTLLPYCSVQREQETHAQLALSFTAPPQEQLLRTICSSKRRKAARQRRVADGARKLPCARATSWQAALQ